MRSLIFAIAMLALVASPPATAQEGSLAAAEGGCSSTHVDGPIVTADVAHGDSCAHTVRVCSPLIEAAFCRAV